MRPIHVPIRMAPFAALVLTGVASAQTSDRYGAGPVVYATPGSRFAPAPSPAVAPPADAPVARSTSSASRAALRTLSWPGKSTPAALAPRPSPRPERTAAPERNAPAADRGWIAVASKPQQAPSAPARLGPPVRPWTERDAASPGPSTAPPPSAYASTAPNPSTGAPNGGARYYSVHRAYGLTPDAAPIPPQFFGPTADLGVPETPDALRRTNPTSAAVNAARLASETPQ